MLALRHSEIKHMHNDAIILAVLTDEELVRVKYRLQKWNRPEVVVVVDMIESEIERRERAHREEESSFQKEIA